MSSLGIHSVSSNHSVPRVRRPADTPAANKRNEFRSTRICVSKQTVSLEIATTRALPKLAPNCRSLKNNSGWRLIATGSLERTVECQCRVDSSCAMPTDVRSDCWLGSGELLVGRPIGHQVANQIADFLHGKALEQFFGHQRCGQRLEGFDAVALYEHTFGSSLNGKRAFSR